MLSSKNKVILSQNNKILSKNDVYNKFLKIKHYNKFFNTNMRDIYPTNKIGYVIPGDINGLIDLINHINLDETKTIIEIGSFYGASTVIFAMSGANVISIEPFSCEVSDMVCNGQHIKPEDFKEVEECFNYNIKEYPNITKIKSDSRIEVEKFEDKSIDVVYIDANHNYEDAKNDILLWERKVKDGGWICGHDFAFEGVAKAVLELYGNNPKVFSDTSWAIKIDEKHNNIHNIYLGTGITENYLSKAIPYLISLNSFNNYIFYKKFCITLGFTIPDYIKNSLQSIEFIYMDMNSQISPNNNNCLQHGEFLKFLNANDQDIIIYTDSDILIQRNVMFFEHAQFLSLQNGDVMVGYNQNEYDTLLKEFHRIEPNINYESLEHILNVNLMKIPCFNTGVIACNYITYKELYKDYNDYYPSLNTLFAHYAKQQFILNFVINTMYEVKIMNKLIHTHGHGEHPYWANYDYNNQIYNTSSGYIGNINSEQVPILFRHNIPNKSINIVIMRAEPRHKGAGYYRIDNVYETLAKRYNNIYRLFENTPENLANADIVVCQRGMDYTLFSKLRNSIKQEAKIIWDGDDDYFNVDDKNPSYEAFKSDKLLLGIRSFLRNSNLLTTSTQYLKDEYSKITNKPIEIIKNTMNINMWKSTVRNNYMKRSFDNLIRIGWQGGDSHYKDIKRIKDQLIRIIKEYKNVRLLTIGWDFTQYADFDQIRDQTEHIGWSEFHPRYTQNILDIDIGIAPLDENIHFNKSKSNIKWLEYSMIGIPTVASNVEPYKDIKNGETGFLLDNNNDNWYNTLKELIENKDLRKRIGINAKEYVEKNYNSIDESDKLHRIILNLMEGKYENRN